MSPSSPPLPGTSQFQALPRVTTPIPEIVQTYTPMGVNENGVKGILRPSGTPGSGNGGMSIGQRDKLADETRYSPFLPKEPLPGNHPKPLPPFTSTPAFPLVLPLPALGRHHAIDVAT